MNSFTAKFVASLVALSIVSGSASALETAGFASSSTPQYSVGFADAPLGLLQLPALEIESPSEKLALWPFCGKKCKSRKWQKKQRVKVCKMVAPAQGSDLGTGKTVICAG